MPWGTIEISNRASNRVKGDAPEQSHQQPNRTLWRLVGVPFNTSSEQPSELQENLNFYSLSRAFSCVDSKRWGQFKMKRPLNSRKNMDCLSEKRRMPWKANPERRRWSQEPIGNYSLAWTINQERTPHICPDEVQNCCGPVPLVWLSFSSVWLSPSLWCLRLYTGFTQQTDDLFLQRVGHEREKNEIKQNIRTSAQNQKGHWRKKKSHETSGSGNTAKQNTGFSKRNSGGGGLQRYKQLESSNGLDLIDTADVMMMRVSRDLWGI